MRPDAAGTTTRDDGTTRDDSKWAWRPRRTGQPPQTRRDRGSSIRKRCRLLPDSLAPLAVALLLLFAAAVENVQALGFFELQILEIENYRGQLATGECCGGTGVFPPPMTANRFNAAPPSLQCAGAPQCNTLFRVCLREYQSRQQQQLPSGSASGGSAVPQAAGGGGGRTSGSGGGGGGDDNTASANHQQHPSAASGLHHCSFGNITSPVLGGNSFTLGGDAAAADAFSSPDAGNRGAAGGNLALPFSFSWTRSFTFILQAMDYNNSTDTMSVIEEATYSGILLPGNEWKALSHLGRTARMAYRVRVRCDRNYYGQTCTKLCKPRDDRFGHYTCGDTDGRKECIPGWQGETCDKAVCKTGCHPVHGKCDYPGGCECRIGWQGELCDQCMTYPGCKHGYCNGTSWQCICDVNWGGILCDQDLNYCGTHEPCLNGGTCKSTAPDRYTCTCPEGFGGANCDVVLNPCATEPCANGGKCRTVDAVTAVTGAPTALGSAPQPPPFLAPKQFQCECRPGWTGSTCNTEIDECATQPPRCLNGGTCVDMVADWRCACLDDRWRGRRCEIDVDECEQSHRDRQSAAADQCGPNAVPCKTTPAGTISGNPGTATTTECVCRRGWTTAGNNSSFVAASAGGCTVNVDDCAGPESKCANGGTCLDLIGGYACACPVGFTGRNCRTQIDPCGNEGDAGTPSANPCKNGGECVPARRWRNGGAGASSAKHLLQQLPYSCICPLGYSGENCEIDRDHCTPNPCRNGGQCLNTPDDYYCQCSGDGWSWHGKNCTVPFDAGVANGNAVRTTVATTTAVVTTTAATVRPTAPAPTVQPAPSERTAVTAVRRPDAVAVSGATERRPQQERGGDETNGNGKTIAVTIVSQQVDNGGIAMCGGHHRFKHWLAEDGCNECKCVESVADNFDDKTTVSTLSATCTNLWCGPSTFDCLSGMTPCTGPNQACVPIADEDADDDVDGDGDDEDEDEPLDVDTEKRENAVADAAGSLLLWRRCLRPPCGHAEPGDYRLRYGYDEDGNGRGEEYAAGGPWRRRRRRGQCVTKTAAVDENEEDVAADDDGDDEDGRNEDGASAMTVWPAAVRRCLPNGADRDASVARKSAADRRVGGRPHRRRRPAEACGRLRVTLDPMRLRRGTRVSAVCHGLRRVLARGWIRDGEDDGPDGTDAVDDGRPGHRVYVMCETAADEADNGRGGRGRRRRRITVQVSVAAVVDKQQHRRATAASATASDGGVVEIVDRAVQTLYRRLGGVVAGTPGTKKSPAGGHRVRPGPSNAAGGGDDNEDAAAWAFLMASVVDVVIGGGGGASVERPSSPAPSNSSGLPNEDYRQYYYYWTGGVACGALATVLAVGAFLLFRYRGGVRGKVRGERAAAAAESLAAVNGGFGSVGGVGDGLMLSLVRRQNEENLKRLQVTGGGNRTSAASLGGEYGGGGGCGRNNLSSAGSSLSCSRVSIVHPLCNAAAPDDAALMQLKADPEDGGKAPEKPNVAPPPPPPVAAVRSVAVAVAVPRQQQPQQQQRTGFAQPIQLCKKTLNVDNDQQQRRKQQQLQQQLLQQQQQQQEQQLQQQQLQQQQLQQQQLQQQQQFAAQRQSHHQQQQRYAAALLRGSASSIAAVSAASSGDNDGVSDNDASESPSLTVLV